MSEDNNFQLMSVGAVFAATHAIATALAHELDLPDHERTPRETLRKSIIFDFKNGHTKGMSYESERMLIEAGIGIINNFFDSWYSGTLGETNTD